MHLYDYQKGTLKTWIGDNKEIRAVLSLAEESGEVIGKYQKYLRGDYSKQQMLELISKELGDLLFYVAVTCNELGLSLDDIAKDNQQKLKDRKARGVLKGSGDSR